MNLKAERWLEQQFSQPSRYYNLYSYRQYKDMAECFSPELSLAQFDNYYLIDAENFSPDCFGSEAALKQITYGDLLLLNKIDLVSHDHHGHDHHGHGHDHEHHHHHSDHLAQDGFVSVSFQGDRPLSLRKFQQFIDHQLPAEVYRGKGIIWFADSKQRHVFQLSGKRVSLDTSDWTETPKNQIVFIGRKLEQESLRQSLKDCEVAQESVTA